MGKVKWLLMYPEKGTRLYVPSRAIFKSSRHKTTITNIVDDGQNTKILEFIPGNIYGRLGIYSYLDRFMDNITYNSFPTPVITLKKLSFTLWRC